MCQGAPMTASGSPDLMWREALQWLVSWGAPHCTPGLRGGCCHDALLRAVKKSVDFSFRKRIFDVAGFEVNLNNQIYTDAAAPELLSHNSNHR